MSDINNMVIILGNTVLFQMKCINNYHYIKIMILLKEQIHYKF